MKPIFFPCHSDSDCPANEQCYRAGTADAECIYGLGIDARDSSTASCHSDSDCPANEQCYRAGTGDAFCIKGLGTPKRCTSTADCSGGRQCYRSECIFMATMKPLFFPCHSDSDCAAHETCYRAGTAYAECIYGLGIVARDSKSNMCDGSMGNYNCVCPKGFGKVGLRTQNGRRQFHCKVISSIGIVIPSFEESVGVDKPVSNDCRSDSECPADEQCYRPDSGVSHCVKKKTLGAGRTCTTHDGKAKANGDEWCGHRGNSVACMDGKIVVLRIGCDVKNCHHDSDCPADSECKVVGLASICKPKGRLAHEGKHAHAHKHKKSKHSSSDSSDSSDPSDGHNRASKTPAHKNMNLDAVLFSNTFQNSVVQALAIVGVLYVLYLGYRSATSALRSKYETIPSAAAEGV